MNPYLRPQTLDQALRALASGPHHILAGGTDFYPARVGRPVEGRLLDITAIADLRVVREEAGHWRIGAAATWSDLLAAPLPPAFEALRLAAREVGGMQIQNAGTVCGNVCNAWVRAASTWARANWSPPCFYPRPAGAHAVIS